MENKLALGKLSIRIFASKSGDKLKAALSQNGFGVTLLAGEGSEGPVIVLYTVIHRSELEHVRDIILSVNPKLFYSVEEVRGSSEGVFHPKRMQRVMSKFDLIKKKQEIIHVWICRKLSHQGR